jgi:tripartite-type tricarboxylate transporter receptor subunit TctC
MQRRALLAALAAPALGAPSLARAQEAPVRLVVASAAGGNADLVARLLAPEFEATLGRRLFVENNAAVSGMRALEAVARAEGDGGTLLFGTVSQLVMALALFDPPPVDLAALRGLAMVNRVPMCLVAHPDHAAPDLAAFRARLAGQRVQVGSGPAGTTTHVTAARFVTDARLREVADAEVIPYASSAVALTDLTAGRLTLMFDALVTALPQHRGGRTRILALASERRSPVLPEVPTMAEFGLSGWVAHTWNSISAPAAMREDLALRLNAAIIAALDRPGLRQRLAELGSENFSEPLGPGDVDRFYAAERALWVPIARAAGVRPQGGS